jgi:hypothetical protein
MKMARYFSSSPEDVIESLEAQVASLRKEVKGLRKVAAKRGAEVYDEASESAALLYEDIAQRVADAMPHIRKSAQRVERHARDNPATAAAVGLVVLGLVAALVMRR